MLRFVERVSVIGCGGIGSWLLPPLLRFLNAEQFAGEIHLWDGDHYSIGNLLRQEAGSHLVGRSKAEALAERYRGEFSIANRGKGWRAARLSGSFKGDIRGVRLAPVNGSLLAGSVQGSLDLGWDKEVSLKGTKCRGCVGEGDTGWTIATSSTGW